MGIHSNEFQENWLKCVLISENKIKMGVMNIPNQTLCLSFYPNLGMR